MTRRSQLWLPVSIRPETVTDLHRYRDLYLAQRVIDHAPVRGDEMYLWPDEEGLDHTDGPLWPVARRFWDSAGVLHLELALLVADPGPEARDYIVSMGNRYLAAGEVDYGIRILNADNRDLDDELRRGMWRKRD